MSEIVKRVEILEDLIASLGRQLERIDTKKEVEEYRNDMNLKLEDFRKGIDEYLKEIDIKNEKFRLEMNRKLDELYKVRKEINDKSFWGLSTLDVVYYNIENCIKEVFDLDITTVIYQPISYIGDEEMSVGVLAACKNEIVFVIELGDSDKESYVDDCKNEMRNFLRFFDNYNGFKVILIYAAEKLTESVINKCTKEKIYAMIVKENLLEIANSNDLKINQFLTSLK